MTRTKTSITASTQAGINYTEDDLFYNPLLRFELRLVELSHRIIPKQPYLIAIPSDLPYRRSSQDPNLWYRKTPFNRREETLQYMSLLPHQDENEELMRVEGDRIDEDDGELIVGGPSPCVEAPSRPSTPQTIGPKKKISLQDYKKDKSGVNTPEKKSADDLLRRQALKSHKEEVELKTAHDSTVQVNVDGKDKEVAKKRSPSKLSEHKERKSSHATPLHHGSDSERPLKKRRLSPLPSSQDCITSKQKQMSAVKEESQDDKPLPVLLSPTLPAQPERGEIISKPPSIKARGLPKLLSPTLPGDLEKLISTQKTDETRSIRAGHNSPAHTPNKIRLSSPMLSGRVRSDSHLSVKPPLAATRPVSPATKTSALDEVSSPTPQIRIASPKPRQRHRVTLKYGKKNKKRVEMILRMRPAKKTAEKHLIQEPAVLPAFHPTEVTLEKEQKPPLPKEPAKAQNVRPEKKRPPEIEVEPPAKKQKTISTTLEPPLRTDRPATPKSNFTKSLASANGKPKPFLSTPQKDPLKSIAMQRITSSDTLGETTPLLDTKPSTPAAVTSFSQPKTSPAPTSTPSRNNDTSKWEELASRLHHQGRILKKEGNSGAQDVRIRDKAGPVIAQIEALLCFMLNTAARAQAHPHAPTQWHTIIPYHAQVWRQSRIFHHLHGLVVQLGAVLRNHLLQEQIRQLSKIHFPDETATSEPTPSSDGTTRTSDDPAKVRKAFLELRDEIAQNSRELRTAWLAGGQILSVRLIEDQYSRTWKARTTDISKRQPDKLDVKALPKQYFLPLDPTTNCFEAANFALVFLEEWTRLEKLDWKSRIEF